MASSNPVYQGNCLCGAVEVKITAAPLLTVACHCRDCQKLSASAFTLTTMFSSDGFSCTGNLVKGGLGTDERQHFCCRSCLSIIYSKIAGADHRVNLRTSILKDAASLAPFLEVMTDEKLPWAQTSAVHSYGQYPTSRAQLQELMDAYASWRPQNEC